MKRSGGTIPRLGPSRMHLAKAGAACGIVLLTATACGNDDAGEHSFTDKNGRACAYVAVEEPDGDVEVNDIDCDFPPTHVPSTPPSASPDPAPTG